MPKPDLSIYPLDLGTLLNFEKSLFTFHRNEGVKEDFPCLGWVILGGAKKILVDTGPPDPEWGRRYYRPVGRTSQQEIPVQLGRIGLWPADIDLIILTHLHWDHTYSMEHFPRVPIYVQSAEVEYASNPLPMEQRAYGAAVPGGRPWMKFSGQFKTIRGDQEIIPGVRVIHLPSHTPGCQGVVVDTREDPWVIAGDMLPLYENWQGDATLDHIPGGVYQNLFDVCSSLKKLDPFGNNVLPSHDIKVLRHKRYPLDDE